MNEKMQILLSVILNTETLSYSRNQDEKQLAIDISDNGDFNNQSFLLQKNIDSGTNSKSIKTLNDIESFVYIYTPYPILGTFTKTDNSIFTLTLIDLTILREPFSNVVLKNLDTVNSTTVKIIYS